MKIFGAVTWFLGIALGFREIYNWDGDNGNGIGMNDLGIQGNREKGCYDKINNEEGLTRWGKWE